MTLFDYQDQELARVSGRIGSAIKDYCFPGRIFHGDDLRKYVQERLGMVAPASCDRVLRDLRKRKVLNYRVVSRRDSMYEVIP